MRIIILLPIVLLLVACSSQATPSTNVTVITQDMVATVDPANIELANAQFNYNRNCAHCHGYGGEGQHPDTIERTQNLGYHTVPPHDETGHTWQHPDQVLFETIKYGIQSPTNFYVMTSFKEQLTDDEIFGVIEYMRRWWTPAQQRSQAQLTEQFAENNPNWSTDRLDDAGDAR